MVDKNPTPGLHSSRLMSSTLFLVVFGIIYCCLQPSLLKPSVSSFLLTVVKSSPHRCEEKTSLPVCYTVICLVQECGLFILSLAKEYKYMETPAHLFSTSARWITSAEFVDRDGNITRAEGESVVEIEEDHIHNTSWVQLGGLTRENNYRITPVSGTHFFYRSTNPELGIQQGTFDIDRNVIYSRFTIAGTRINGYEIITCEADGCHTQGALYESDLLINTWRATMRKG